MKAGRGVKWAVITAALLLAFDVSAQARQQPAPAEGGDDARPQRMGQGSMGRGSGPGPHRQERRQAEGGGSQGMGQGMRSTQFAADEPAAPRGARMSKEERRQLRRDVDQAGRDLYPERKHGRGREQHQPSPTGQPPAQ